jgi:4-amino-4-deoxy-L-arabinose transferase-like glycosyltransferase
MKEPFMTTVVSTPLENTADRQRKNVIAVLAVTTIILLGAVLRFYQLGAYNIGNAYYAATVKSMLVSWQNFFFVAFEPGGSVTVDKPPLGFWLEALSAYFLGLNGFALALPNALAGTLSIPVLYVLIRKPFGVLAGLVAALTLAVTPVVVSTERNNTIDGMLVFVLLLASWATWKSVESGRFRYLLLAAFLVGLGFNIKMLQAYMILPALYALYFLGAKHSWIKRLVHLGIATGLLLVVSLAWAVVVDLVPAENRPFIGSSTNNTVMELITGHNGMERLTGGPGPGGAPGGNPMASNIQVMGGANGQNPPRNGQPGPAPDGKQLMPPIQNNNGRPGQPPNGPRPGSSGGQPGGPASEVGQASILRLFSEPLVTEVSWMLPLALLGIILALAVLGIRALTDKHLALVLWAGWLLPVGLYFTVTSGIFHAYYLIMLGAPVAALVGVAVWALGQFIAQQRWCGWGLVTLLSGITLGFEIYVLSAYPAYFAATSTLMLVLWLAAIGLLAVRPRRWTLASTVLSLLIAPLLWSGLTTFNTNPEVWLPKAGTAAAQPGRPTTLTEQQQTILDYLLARQPDGYLLATLSANEASTYILATGRPVLTFGGFSGNDNVIGTDQLAQMVAGGELRFVLAGDRLAQSKPEIAAWLRQSCQVVDLPGLAAQMNTAMPGPGGPGQATILYDCKK